jgi:hypothetical protein
MKIRPLEFIVLALCDLSICVIICISVFQVSDPRLLGLVPFLFVQSLYFFQLAYIARIDKREQQESVCHHCQSLNQSLL